MGVWIETLYAWYRWTLEKVTPCVGVWIETWQNTQNMKLYSVTPCVGVWIETWEHWYFSNPTMSHPAWVCGLKLRRSTNSITSKRSHPAWVCGLKPELKEDNPCYQRHTLRGCVDWNNVWDRLSEMVNDVTPCVGVWIETFLNLTS